MNGCSGTFHWYFSSGKMGFALAEECAKRGAEVLLVSGPTALKTTNPGIYRTDVESAQQMLDAAVGAFPVVDAAILSAAVADFRPTLQWQEKIKRNDRNELILTLTANPDIAASLGLMKESHQTLVGFALETNDEEQNALKKLGKKNLDFIVLNSMRDEGAGFGGDTNKVTILSRDGNKYRSS